MMVKMKHKCDGCGRVFEGWSTLEKQLCVKCGKPFVFCGICELNPPKCDWCGGEEFKREGPKVENGRIWLS